MDFILPEEILSVVPTDPYEQLDMARKIMSMAIASRVSKMEAEMARMWDNLCQKGRTIYGLEEKLSSLQQANQEADSRLKLAFAENLETFKRQLMQSLSEDNACMLRSVTVHQTILPMV